MLINFSNHPSAQWGSMQKQTAIENYGSIKDVPFPSVDPKGNEDYIKQLSQKYAEIILSHKGLQAVHIMGEQNLCYAVIVLLKARGVECVASTSKREIDPNGVPLFTFERFRKY